MYIKDDFLKDFAVVILAAGFSGRMGIPKLSLPFDEHRSFAGKIIQEYLLAGCKNIVIVVNEPGLQSLKQQKYFPDKAHVSVILNNHPERERFFSLQTGLQAIRTKMPVFIQNIDNPFINRDLLFRLAKTFRREACIVPRHNGYGGHPVLLSWEIARDLERSPDWTQNLRDFLQAYPIIGCPVSDENIFININSPQEYQKYFGKAGQ